MLYTSGEGGGGGAQRFWGLGLRVGCIARFRVFQAMRQVLTRRPQTKTGKGYYSET